MTVYIVRPAAISSSSGDWGVSAGPDVVTAVSDANDGTGIASPTLLQDILFSFAALPVTQGKVTHVDLKTRGEQNAGNDASAFAIYSLDGVSTTGAALGGAPGVPQTFTDDLTSILTTITKINRAKFGAVENNYATVPYIVVDQWLEVTVVPFASFRADVQG